MVRFAAVRRLSIVHVDLDTSTSANEYLIMFSFEHRCREHVTHIFVSFCRTLRRQLVARKVCIVTTTNVVIAEGLRQVFFRRIDLLQRLETTTVIYRLEELFNFVFFLS